MEVVDGVTPVILDVPAEGGEAHANIKPGQRHAADVSCHMSQNRRVHHRQVVEVPAALEVFLQEIFRSHLYSAYHLIIHQTDAAKHTDIF